MTTHVVVIIDTIFPTFYKPYTCVFVCVYMAKMNKKHFIINIYKNQNANLYPFIYYPFFITYTVYSICTILYIFFYILAIPVNRSCI